MVKDVREVTDNGVAITNDPDEIAVAQVDGDYSDADHRIDDARRGPDPNHEHADNGEDEEGDDE